MELKLAIAPAGEREGHDGHVVHVFRLDEKRSGSRREKILVGHELVVQIDEARFHRLADVEADDDQCTAGPRDGVDVLYALDLGDLPLERLGQLLFDDFGRCTGKRQPDIGHGDDDLRLFFTRGDQNGEQAEQQRAQHDQRRQLAADEEGGDAAGQAGAIWRVGSHWSLVIGKHPTSFGPAFRPPIDR
jgi:hypothetical protein